VPAVKSGKVLVDKKSPSSSFGTLKSCLEIRVDVELDVELHFKTI
jgi:hypothetical protein